MERQQVRQIVTSQFYQSLAEGGVEITAIPQAQLQAMVNAMADGVFAALEALDDEDFAHPQAMRVGADPGADVKGAAQAADDGESFLWRGRPYLTIGVRYELTSQRLRIIRGIFGKRLEEVELVRVRDTKVKQHAGERAINVGDVTIFSNDPSTPEFVLHNVRNPMDVREQIRKATLEEKERRGLYYREEM